MKVGDRIILNSLGNETLAGMVFPKDAEGTIKELYENKALIDWDYNPNDIEIELKYIELNN